MFGASFDWKPTARFDLVGTFRRIGGNNAANLPSYALTNVGSIVHLGRGSVVLTASNLFNQGATRFAEPASASILGDPRFRLLPIPVAPRSFQAAFRVRVGASPPPRSSKPVGAPSRATTTVGVRFIRDQKHPPADPYAIDRNNPHCGPEDLALVQPVLSALATYVKSGTFVPLKALSQGETARYRRSSSGAPAFLLRGSRMPVRVALFNCMKLYVGTAQEVVAHGGYVPTEKDTWDIAFAPSIGAYLPYTRAQVITRTARLLAFPASAPAQPFALNATKSCTPDIKGASKYTLDALASYFAAVRDGKSSKMPDGVTVSAHQSPKRWFALQFDDNVVKQALGSCAFVHGITSKQAAQAGISGDPRQLNYAPAVGLYKIVAPSPRP